MVDAASRPAGAQRFRVASCSSSYARVETTFASQTGNKIDERLDWSPDGTQITFSRNGNVWTIDADGTDSTQLTDNRCHEFAPAFSSDGTMIAFNKEGRSGRFGVWTMLADASASEQRTFGLFDLFRDRQPV